MLKYLFYIGLLNTYNSLKINNFNQSYNYESFNKINPSSNIFYGYDHRFPLTNTDNVNINHIHNNIKKFDLLKKLESDKISQNIKLKLAKDYLEYGKIKGYNLNDVFKNSEFYNESD